MTNHCSLITLTTVVWAAVMQLLNQLYVKNMSENGKRHRVLVNRQMKKLHVFAAEYRQRKHSIKTSKKHLLRIDFP